MSYHVHKQKLTSTADVGTTAPVDDLGLRRLLSLWSLSLSLSFSLFPPFDLCATSGGRPGETTLIS